MFLLVRDVSQYTEWNPIFLGVFSDEAKANDARAVYIAATEKNDPWKEQAYKVPDLASDVRTTPIESHCLPEATTVYLVTRHLEGMGQVSRWYLSVYSRLDDALARAAAEDAEEKVIVEYISVEKFDVNDTRYFDYALLPFKEFDGGLWSPPEGH
jgi:hypothetical protein